MKRLILSLLASLCLAGQTAAWTGQAPGAASDPDIPVSHDASRHVGPAGAH